jgi:hypothetical protein
MAIPSAQLVDLVRSGGSASIDATEYTSAELITVARAMPAKVTLIVRNTDQWSPAERIEIVRAAGGTVLFEL